MTLTREQILSAQKARKPVRLEVPEWGGDVYIKVLSANDQTLLTQGAESDMPARVIVACLVDEDGKRIFEDDDIGPLMDTDFPTFMRIFAEVARINGMSTKELDEAVESFRTAPDEFSFTG